MSTKVLEVAILSRLTGDATLMALVGQGVWNTYRPEEIEKDTAQPLTWVTFTVIEDGEPNDATGGRFKDVLVQIMVYADATEGSTKALNIDDRITTLINDWTPTLTGWAGVWKAYRTDTLEAVMWQNAQVIEYQIGGLYRFQYGQST